MFAAQLFTVLSVPETTTLIISNMKGALINMARLIHNFGSNLYCRQSPLSCQNGVPNDKANAPKVYIFVSGSGVVLCHVLVGLYIFRRSLFYKKIACLLVVVKEGGHAWRDDDTPACSCSTKTPLIIQHIPPIVPFLSIDCIAINSRGGRRGQH